MESLYWFLKTIGAENPLKGLKSVDNMKFKLMESIEVEYTSL
jgi:hypothetical protein